MPLVETELNSPETPGSLYCGLGAQDGSGAVVNERMTCEHFAAGEHPTRLVGQIRARTRSIRIDKTFAQHLVASADWNHSKMARALRLDRPEWRCLY
jgi:hypothetical protein